MPFKQIANGILRPRPPGTGNAPNFIGKITFTTAAGKEITLPLAGWKKHSKFDGGGAYVSLASSIKIPDEEELVDPTDDIEAIIEELGL